MAWQAASLREDPWYLEETPPKHPKDANTDGKADPRDTQRTNAKMVEIRQCPLCQRCFSKKKYLDQHELTHSGMKPFVCPRCGKAFTRYHCQFCHKGFAKASGLKDHVRIHTGERPFKCHVCDKRFNVKSNLVKHAMTHMDSDLFNSTT
ncbi:hypothetical protein DPMN_021610 [Dreissena polymorpha]|uniref:C2H2-type domain-containing protein n=1 Tax=Dreissena polymorpha TaxID=45954 RepID=A0A9D4SBW8_DREPO|nr:hypothetical protein DPMN_021610 [Dreissena polymorpha]